MWQTCRLMWGLLLKLTEPLVLSFGSATFVAVLMSGVVEQVLGQPLLTSTHNKLCFTKFVSPQQSCSTTPDINVVLSPTFTLVTNTHS